MGIDPQTHKPISPPNSDGTHLPQKEQKHQKPPKKQLPPPEEAKKDDGKEAVVVAVAADDGTSMMEELMVDGFCTEEVPVIDHEILVPCASSSSPTSTSSTSYSCSSSSSSSNSELAAANSLLQDLVNEFPEFEWPNICENNCMEEEPWEEDEFGIWDFVFNNNNNPCVTLELDNNPQPWPYGLL